jgi:hypothetical protein
MDVPSETPSGEPAHAAQLEIELLTCSTSSSLALSWMRPIRLRFRSIPRVEEPI